MKMMMMTLKAVIEKTLKQARVNPTLIKNLKKEESSHS
jgi:hypothetical protein